MFFFLPWMLYLDDLQKKVSEKWLITKQRIQKFTQNGRFSLINLFIYFLIIATCCFSALDFSHYSSTLHWSSVALPWGEAEVCCVLKPEGISSPTLLLKRTTLAPWRSTSRDRSGLGTQFPPHPIIKFYSSAVERAAPTRRAESSLHPRWLKPSRCCGRVTQRCRHSQR